MLAANVFIEPMTKKTTSFVAACFVTDIQQRPRRAMTMAVTGW